MQTRRLALVQGAYFLGTGLWPILHLRSFEAITGPKPEGWLVKALGAVIAVTGATLIAAGARDRVTAEIAGLAMGSAAALGAVDAVYGLRRRISPVYLGDAVVEAAIVSAWMVAAARRRRARRAEAPVRAGPRPRPVATGIRP